MQNVASQNFPRLVGDIGGTNIRLAVIAAAGEAPAQIRSFACASFPGPEAAIRHYLATDKTAPASRPLQFVVRDGSMRGGTIQINAAFFDLINTAWPRNFYTLDFAPGLKYFR